jgi:hypothetical protein
VPAAEPAKLTEIVRSLVHMPCALALAGAA